VAHPADHAERQRDAAARGVSRAGCCGSASPPPPACVVAAALSQLIPMVVRLGLVA
jgi:hypothetical protein